MMLKNIFICSLFILSSSLCAKEVLDTFSETVKAINETTESYQIKLTRRAAIYHLEKKHTASESLLLLERSQKESIPLKFVVIVPSMKIKEVELSSTSQNKDRRKNQ